MRFIFKLHQPLLGDGFPVRTGHGNRHLDGTGVDFFRFVEIRDFALLFEQTHPHGGHIHQGHVFLADPVTVNLAAGVHIGLQRILDSTGQGAPLRLYAFEAGQKGGVTAVVGPIRVDHPQFGDGGIPLFLVPEIPLTEQQILQRHGEAHALPGILHLIPGHGKEPRHPGHIGGTRRRQIQGVGFIEGGQPGFHGIDQVVLDPFHIRLGKLPFQADHPRGQHPGPLALGEKLHALGRRVRPLVILAGQIFHGKHLPSRF